MSANFYLTVKNIRWCFSIVIIFSVCSSASAEAQFTLQKLIEKTVTSNPEVQARYHNFKAAEQEQKAAQGGYFPRVDVISTIRRQEEMTPNINNTATPDSQTQLVLRQMLFDGFATRSEVSRLGHAARVRYYELQSAMQNTALETVKAYIDVQRYRQLVSYAQDNYVVHKQLFDRIEERVTAGVGRRVDLEQANGRFALAEANLLTEVTNLQNVTARYQRLTGELPPTGLPEVEFFKAGVATTATEALQLAYQKNPEILSTIENIVATQQEVEYKRSKYYPRLDLQARKNLLNSSNGDNSTAVASLLELTATFNLFNGFTDKSVIAQTVDKLSTAEDLRDKACVDTRQTLAIAYNDIRSLKEQLNYRDQHQLSIEKAREAYRKQFDIGQRTLLDLLDTENEFFQARRTYTNTERDLYTAYARTYASQGDLLGKLNVVRSDLPDVAEAGYMENYKICQAVAPEAIQIDKAALVAKAKPLNSDVSDKKIAPSVVSPVKPLVKSAVAPIVEAPVVAKEGPGRVVPDVQFETNSAKIKKVSYDVLDNAVKTVKSWGTSKVEIAGHTDKRETSKENYNLDLSQRRAKAVSNYLEKQGVDPARLIVKGYGYSMPIAENDPKEGSVVNRRVELIRQKN